MCGDGKSRFFPIHDGFTGFGRLAPEREGDLASLPAERRNPSPGETEGLRQGRAGTRQGFFPRARQAPPREAPAARAGRPRRTGTWPPSMVGRAFPASVRAADMKPFYFPPPILRNISGMAAGFIGFMSTRSRDFTMCSVPCL